MPKINIGNIAKALRQEKWSVTMGDLSGLSPILQKIFILLVGPEGFEPSTP